MSDGALSVTVGGVRATIVDAPDPRACRCFRGRHGWLLRFRDGGIVVAREFEGGADAAEAPLDESESDRGALHLFLHGDELAAPVLDALDRVVAGGLDPAQRVIALAVFEERDDRQFHCCLKMLERPAQRLGDLSDGVHRVISHAVRVAARARRAASRSIMADLAAAHERAETQPPETVAAEAGVGAAFARFRTTYPERHRPTSEDEWNTAALFFNELVAAGTDRAMLADSAANYARYIASNGRTGTRFILPPAVFLRERAFEDHPPFVAATAVPVTIVIAGISVRAELPAAKAREIGRALIAAASPDVISEGEAGR